MENPVRLIIIGFVLLLCGAVLPFLMVIGLLINTLPLNFLAYFCSVAGLVTGFIGIAQYNRREK
jgi:uncharacterized membrane protein YiaA